MGFLSIVKEMMVYLLHLVMTRRGSDRRFRSGFMALKTENSSENFLYDHHCKP